MLSKLQIWLADHFACFQYPAQEYAPHGLPSQWKCGTSRTQRLMVFFASWMALVVGLLLVAVLLFVVGPLLAV